MDKSRVKVLIQNIIQADEALVERIFTNYPIAIELLLASKEDFQRIQGITPHKARKLYSTFQIAKELHRPREPAFVRSPQDIYDLLSTELRYLQHEHFVCLFLNTKNRVIGQKTIAIGSLNATIVHPREVFKAAIGHSCASIICVHNHPSGDPTPSHEDIVLTKRLIAAGELIGVEMLDHLIIGGNTFLSIKEQGIV